MLFYASLLILGNLPFFILWMKSFVVGSLVLAMLMVLMGGALTLFESKVLSMYQCSVGPDVVGESGRLQFLVDALKVLFKEVIHLNRVDTKASILLPMYFLALNTYYVYAMEDQHMSNYLNWNYTPLVMLALLAVSNYLVVMVGQVLKNRYTSLAAMRAANMGVSVDLLFTLLMGILGLLHGSLQYMSLSAGSGFAKMLILLPMLPIVLLTVLADMGKPPFDLVESESELIMGVHSELSGFLFVVWLLGEYLHIFMLTTFVVAFIL